MSDLVLNTLLVKQEPKGSIETIELTWDQRSKPRGKYKTDQGTEIVLSLPRGTILHDGDTLFNSETKTINVRAKAETVLVVRPQDISQACRIAHQLGNWHRAVQIDEDDCIITEPDSPLKKWLDDNGIKYSEEQRSYSPNLRTAPH